MTKSEGKTKRNAQTTHCEYDKVLAKARREIQIGLEQLNRAEGIRGEDVYKEMTRKSRFLGLRRSKWK